MTDAELYSRGAKTLLAAWELDARGCRDAALERLEGVAAAVFPSGPERGFLNNALLDRDLGQAERARAVDQMAAAYEAAEVASYAAWVHESDEPMQAELTGRGYVFAESTLAMGRSLDDLPAGEPSTVEASDWAAHLEHLEAAGAPAGLLRGTNALAYQVAAATQGGEEVATGIAYDHEGDCGVFNVITVEKARRQGLGTAVTKYLIVGAAARGCSTASLQSTPIAEGVYASLGFRSLGRILEYAPPS